MQRLIDSLSAAADWAEAHPFIFGLVVWPFVLGFFNLLFKPRTPAEYAAIARTSPRLAGFLQLMGALGIDPVKVAQVAFEKVLKGNAYLPPPPPPPPESLPPPRGPTLLTRAALVLCIGLCGCSWLQSHGPDLVDLLARKTQCALRRMSAPDEVIWKECGLQPEDLEKIIPLVSAARQEAAKEAAAARADEHVRVAAQRCTPDAGTP